MARKKWTPQEEETPSLIQSREKRKWQITLRRYVLEKMPSPNYAPYFGLDINSMRAWFESQFSPAQSWENFAKAWQFDQVVPAAYFNQTVEEDLRLCWSFTNQRIASTQFDEKPGYRLDMLGAKAYFSELLKRSDYGICRQMLVKLGEMEDSQLRSVRSMQGFMEDQKELLATIYNYSAFEFELLNSGRSLEEVKKEIDSYRQMGGRE